MSAQRSWKLEDAKARFSELVRRAGSEGPQEVTLRGRRAVVVVEAEAWDRLQPASAEGGLVEFLESLDLGGLDLTREDDRGREPQL